MSGDMKEETAKLPWVASASSRPMIVDAKGDWVADCGMSLEPSANRAFIVRAVNNHEAMLAALEGLIAYIEELSERRPPEISLAPHKAIGKARDTIDEAKA